MNYVLNGQSHKMVQTMNVADMLQHHGYENMIVAVAINDHFVPRSSYNERYIQTDDIVDIVAPMQGG